MATQLLCDNVGHGLVLFLLCTTPWNLEQADSSEKEPKRTRHGQGENYGQAHD